MNGRKLATVAAVTLICAACTPEEQTAVINDYAARMTAREQVDAPVVTAATVHEGAGWRVESTCDDVSFDFAGLSEGSRADVGAFGTAPAGVRLVNGEGHLSMSRGVLPVRPFSVSVVLDGVMQVVFTACD